MWIGLDPATGRVRSPSIELGFVPAQPLEYADLDGDGSADVLALERGKVAVAEPLTDPNLAAFSGATGARLWGKNLMSFYRPVPAVAVRDWPLAADFDSDGRAEVVVPHVDALPSRNNRALYGGIRMLDGATGETRWDCPLWPGMISGSDSLVHMLAGPDLDADGSSDLVVVSRFDGRHPNEAFVGQRPELSRVYVDAISGALGRHLWHWHTELTNAHATPIGPAFWWGMGSDGWQMLALAVGDGLGPGIAQMNRYRHADPPVVHFLAAATGTELHTMPGLSWPMTAVLDGDGLADLWGSIEGKLRAYRGGPPEAWRALGRLQPAGDFDGDGITDVVCNDLEPPRGAWDARTESRTALARSGRDGQTLWRTPLDPLEDWFSWGSYAKAYHFKSSPLPDGDLDGDGAPDVVVRKEVNKPMWNNRTSLALPLQALSGRTGALLWSAGALPPLGFKPYGGSFIEGIDIRACDPNGLPDVLVLYDVGVVGPSVRGGIFDTQARLARFSGRDGRVIWDVVLAEHKGGTTRLMGFVHELADVDGDGGLEVVLLLKSMASSGPTPCELRVLSLGNGEVRWRHQLNQSTVASAAFAIGDLDGDRRPEVVVREQPGEPVAAAIDVAALDGQTGERRWSWRGGEARDDSDKTRLLRLAKLGDSGRMDVCVNFSNSHGRRRVVILDAQGNECNGRDLESETVPTLVNVDVDRDGRDELLFHDGGRLHACRGDLKELWSWPTDKLIQEVLPASAGVRATVVIDPSLGLDGATGLPIWSGGPARSILKATDDKSLPRALTGPDGTTVCRVAMPIMCVFPWRFFGYLPERASGACGCSWPYRRWPQSSSPGTRRRSR
jgi:hypothetical protein